MPPVVWIREVNSKIVYLDTRNLNQRMLLSSDDELLNIVTTRRAEYRQVAVDLAAKELMRRNVPLPALHNIQSSDAHQLACSKEPEPKETSNGSLIAWLVVLLGYALLGIIAYLLPDYRLLPENRITDGIMSCLVIAYVIHRLYKLYKWYKSED